MHRRLHASATARGIARWWHDSEGASKIALASSLTNEFSGTKSMDAEMLSSLYVEHEPLYKVRAWLALT